MPHQFKLIYASWISKNQVLVMLSHDWPRDKDLPPLYLNSVDSPVLAFQPAPLYLLGKLTGYFTQEESITFLYPWNKLENSKKVFVAGSFNNWGAAIGLPEWQLKLGEVEGQQALLLTVPWESCRDTHHQSFFKFVTEDNVWLSVPVDAPNFVLDPLNNSNYQINSDCTGQNAFLFDPSSEYDPAIHDQILWVDEDLHYVYPVDDRAALLSLGSTQPLGAIVGDKSTIFRIFAPRAKTVKVTFYDEPDRSRGQTLNLKRNSDYTWELIYPMNLDRKYYDYTVLNGQSEQNLNLGFNILDPYALATVGPGGPGIIIDIRSIPKMDESFEVPAWIDLVILEAHLRDLVSRTPFGVDFQVPIGFRNLFAWFESKHNYIKELGVNAIELLPVQEYESGSPLEYHWGYMTTNYFCPSSCYASKKDQASQIAEFQELVTTFHKAGIAVILDVVYNHSGNPNHLLHIDRDYYFESTKDGYLTNWSGCGNDFRADTPMGKRLIIDSLVYLIKTYNVDGFRLDLAELIGVEVLREVELALKAAKPSIILIAEPWSFRGHIAYELKSTDFASWNDGYREFIVSYVLGHSNGDAFSYFITGSTSYLARFTAQSVNYASSHDDYCWLDRITENENHDGFEPTINDIRRTHLMVAILMMSVGIPMLAEGQDILYSKMGHNNTYERGDLNALDYNNRVEYSGTHEYFSKWICFRLSESGRAIRIKEIPSSGYFKFFMNSESSAIGVLYNADFELKDVHQLLFVVNPHLTIAVLDMGDLELKDFMQIADSDRVNEDGLEERLIIWEDSLLTLPPLGCGLWINRNLKA